MQDIQKRIPAKSHLFEKVYSPPLYEFISSTIYFVLSMTSTPGPDSKSKYRLQSFATFKPFFVSPNPFTDQSFCPGPAAGSGFWKSTLFPVITANPVLINTLSLLLAKAITTLSIKNTATKTFFFLNLSLSHFLLFYFSNLFLIS